MPNLYLSISNDDFDLLKWLRDEGLEWNEQTYTKAAKGVNIDILK